MPILAPCSTPHCPGYTDRLGSLCLDCQRRVNECPNCGRHNGVVLVTPETVVDIFDICLARPVGAYTAHLTVKIPVIVIERK